MVIYYQKEDDGFMVIHQLLNETEINELKNEDIYVKFQPEHSSNIYLRGGNLNKDFMIVPCDHEKKFNSKLMIKYNFDHIIKF